MLMECYNFVHQADQTFVTSKDLLKDLNKTHQKGKNLLIDTDELLKRIQGKAKLI